MADCICEATPLEVEALVAVVGAAVGAATVWLLQKAYGVLTKCKYDFNEFQCLPEFGGDMLC